MSPLAITAAPATSPPRRLLIVGAAVLGPLMQEIDSLVVGVALPHMQATMSAAPDQITWVLTSFLIAIAIMSPAVGRASAIVGRKRLMLIAVAGFAFTSIFCGTSTTIDELVFFRFIQGIFAAFLTPLFLSTLLDAFPREEHGMALGLWGVGIMLAPILGPTIGAYITEFYTWRSVFFFNLPVGLFAYTIISVAVPEAQVPTARPFSYVGFAMIAIGVGSLQFILDQGERLDWFGSPQIAVAGVIAGLGFYGFILNTIFSRHPFLDIDILKDRNFSAGLVLNALLSVMLVSIVALLPPLLQDLKGYPIITTGQVMAPRGLSIMISVIVVGYLHKRIEARPLMVFGMLMMALSTWLMAVLTVNINTTHIVVVNTIQGVGWGFFFVPLTAASFSTLAPRLRDEGTALFALIANLGKSFGVSLMVGFLVRDSQVNRSAMVENVSIHNDLFRHLPLPAVWDIDAPLGLAMLNQEINRQALTMAYINDFRMLTIIILVCVPMVYLMRKPPRF